MSAEEKAMLQRIAEGMNALPEPEQKYILGFAEGALAAAKRPKSDEPEITKLYGCTVDELLGGSGRDSA